MRGSEVQTPGSRFVKEEMPKYLEYVQRLLRRKAPGQESDGEEEEDEDEDEPQRGKARRKSQLARELR